MRVKVTWTEVLVQSSVFEVDTSDGVPTEEQLEELAYDHLIEVTGLTEVFESVESREIGEVVVLNPDDREV